MAETAPTPGEIESQLKFKVETPISPPSITTLPQAAPLPTAATEKRIHISHIKFQGHSLFNNRELKEVVADALNADLTLADIYALAHRLTRFYRDHDYLLAIVTVPAQKISDGTLLFDVIEGVIEDINIEGNQHYSSTFIKQKLRRLSSENIFTHIGSTQSKRALQGTVLEHELLLLNDFPGLSAQAILMPGSEYGTSDLLIKVDDELISGAITLNNHGRETLGTQQLTTNLNFNSPLGLGDSLQLTAVGAPNNRILYGKAHYSLPMNEYGSRAGIEASRFTYDVDTSKLAITQNNTLATNLTGSGNTYRAFYQYPWVRSRGENRTIEVALVQKITTQAGTLALFDRLDDEINLLEISLQLQKDFSHSTSSMMTTFTTLLDNGADNNATTDRLNNLQLDLRHQQFLSAAWSIKGRSLLAYSPDPLVDTERFRLGGPNNVRAYPSAEIGGDYGAMLSLDIVHASSYFNNYLRSELSLFVDGGTAYQHDRSAGEEKSTTISGAGVGLVLRIAKSFTMNVQYSKPLSDLDASDNEDQRVWASVSQRF